jgi:hypothetical protein
MFQILFDKRFSFRFRILNLLSGDYLRNYLAVGVNCPLIGAVDVLDSSLPDSAKLRMLDRHIRKAKRGLDDVFNI